MTDSQEQNKKDTLTVSTPSRLSLTKTVESGKVKQNFQHGRSKTVTVEVRKTRTFAGQGGVMVEVKKPGPGEAGKSFSAAADDDSLRHLTPGEREARLRALKFAEEESRLAAVTRRETPKTVFHAPEEELVQEEAPPPPTPPVEEPKSKTGIVTPRLERQEMGLRTGRPESIILQGEGVARSREKKPDVITPIKPVQASTPSPAAPSPKMTLPSFAGDDAERERAEAKPGKIRLRRDESRRNSGKITVTQALGLSDEQRQRSMASIRRQREKAKKAEMGIITESEKISREVVIPEIITVQELANRMAERAVDVVKILMKLGTMATVNQSIDADTAELVAGELGHKVKRVTEGDVENILREENEDPESLLARAPVVTIMGHVDHGKTSLLDALRKTDVAAGEAGGITQHIGAYQVALSSGAKITFLDTPGHEAFTAMRARGAKITDIVVLVVAADDGIMEQTKEAISHAKAAKVPIIVAINKIDKPDADPQRVKNELMSYELVPEEFGGDVMVVEVSAKQNIGLDKLEETILLQAEVLELKANPNRTAAGVVVEAKIDRGRGVVATLLIQRGTLKVGDIVVAGSAYGKVRALTDDKGRTLKEAPPTLPVEIQGLDSAPEAGDEFAVVENEKTARDITEYREKRDKARLSAISARSLDQLFAASGTGKVKELPLIVKADVQGSTEAIIGSVMKFSGEEVAVRVLHSGVGGISESDITLANATGAIIIGFNVRASAQARALADRQKVNIRYYSIIYDVVDDIKAALSGMLNPTKKEKFLGLAEIRQVFNLSKFGKIAGCMVTEGMVKRGAKVRLLRDNIVIHEGMLKTLKRFKDDVKEVKSGFECGMAFENYEDIRENDQIEAFEIEEIARTVG